MGTFGDSVAGVGFCLIVFSIFLFIVPKLNVIICLLMLAAGVPLVIVGIRVARWDKTEEPKMTKIDPALSYRYLLCIGDKEEPLEDMAKLEQAYTRVWDGEDPLTELEALDAQMHSQLE